MITSPYITAALARELLAHAEAQRLGRQLDAMSRARRQASLVEQRLGSALRRIFRLRTAVRA